MQTLDLEEKKMERKVARKANRCNAFGVVITAGKTKKKRML